MPKKVLVLTNSQDIHADLVIRELQRRGVPLVRFHPNRFPTEVTMTCRDGVVHVRQPEGHDFSTDEVGVVWNRRPKSPVADGTITKMSERKFIEMESERFLENLYALLEDVPWVNSFEHNRKARNKLLQRRLAAELGLLMPECIVTNDPAEARAFCHRHKKVVYKAVHNGIVPMEDHDEVIFTRLLGPDDIKRMDSIRLAPGMFMPYVEKRSELRVTVVGNAIFPCLIDSQSRQETSIDWRRGASRHEVAEIPEKLEAELLAFCKRLSMTFATIDLILTPKGDYVMLELNPNGQWAFVQGETGMPIAASIADFLQKEARHVTSDP